MANKTYTTCSKCGAVNRIETSKVSTASCGKCQTPLSFHSLVSEQSADGLLKLIEKADMPIVVDFWAPWCGPCRMFAPTFEAASKYSEGKMVFVKINTEQYPEISSRFNIRGIPSLIIFKNGKEIARESGAFPLDHFKNWISKFF